MIHLHYKKLKLIILADFHLPIVFQNCVCTAVQLVRCMNMIIMLMKLELHTDWQGKKILARAAAFMD